MHEETPKHRYVFKVIILGDYAVGKTCIIHRYVTNTFEEDYKASIGVNITSHRLQFDDQQVQLQLWDMSGQMKFSEIRRQFMLGAECGIIVYDVTRPDSLENVASKMHEAQAISPGIPFALVGNKIDLTEKREVHSTVADQYARNHNMLFHVETSAKSGVNVARLFTELAQNMLGEEKEPTLHSGGEK